ncbi:uncharacterized protein BO87DRAFT_438747 [Aspergillus neoniger CBS 115656]|uniref:Uncharacterized protein n=1 Tax=Aspergillus neoniger (strain CBS 115656) TaxID=1448310 RepID=A0A318YHJ2_ASPNB|nr:hypothetical protein BO87DRAFT_438747 [Aspergillus neoniger CBS 115656]PYH33217.1 hypothetical protein BO87DRAFT_438747 [Aspergillus neoniger CBS 115656]
MTNADDTVWLSSSWAAFAENGYCLPLGAAPTFSALYLVTAVDPANHAKCLSQPGRVPCSDKPNNHCKLHKQNSYPHDIREYRGRRWSHTVPRSR